MQPWLAEVPINQQDTPVLFASNGLCEVRGNKSFSFTCNGAGDKNFFQRRCFSQVVNARTERAELFGAHRLCVGRRKDESIRIRRPHRFGAFLEQIFKSRQRSRVSLGPRSRTWGALLNQGRGWSLIKPPCWQDWFGVRSLRNGVIRDKRDS